MSLRCPLLRVLVPERGDTQEPSLPSPEPPFSSNHALWTCEACGREYGFGLVQSSLPFRAKGITGKVDKRPENPTRKLGRMMSVTPASERSK